MASYSSAPVKRVKRVQFGVLSPEEMKSLSVVNIDSAEIYEEGTTRPKNGGLADPRLGSIDRNFKCQTCSEDMAECSGHFGHIELAKPVYHVGVKKIVECICVQCGKLKVDMSDPKLREIVKHIRDPKRRLAAVHDLAKGKTVCEPDDPEIEDPAPQSPVEATGGANGLPDGLTLYKMPIKGRHGGCGHHQPLIRKEGLKITLVYTHTDVDEEGGKGAKRQERKNLSAEACRNVLGRISDEDLEFMGVSVDDARPIWMILTVLPVPPPAVRPSVAIDGGAMRGEDDLTYKLCDILKANSNLMRLSQDGAPAHVLTDLEQLLQWHIATYMDNDLPGQPPALQKSGRPIKSIRARLKGKEGRLRGNLMGKRVDFSARTVITGDPNIDLDEVGVPYSIARNLTYPERVTPYNITYLQELVRNGPNTHPGARYVVRDTGERIDLRYNKRADTFLQYGWIVERHLRDGDLVLFNRQPSLHKMSMMAHRVKLMPYSTFRLNLSVTPPYNADFDGDEMNLHVPQSEETRAELQQIAWVPRQIVSPQANKPVMGIVQDTLCGIRKFTLRDCFMDRDFVQNILMWLPGWDGVVPPPTIFKPKQLWTGKQVLSMCIPKGINIRGAEDSKLGSNATDKGMWIENGEIIYGVVQKRIAGASSGGLVDVIFREKGPEACRDFFSAAQKVVNYWLLHNGFSIGIGDTIADPATMTAITNFILTAKQEVESTIEDAQQDRLEQLPGMTIRESFESKVNTALNKARDEAGKSAEQSLKDDNNVKQMVVAAFINISQMSACVGQQSVEGQRIPFGFKHRTLPHFTKDDYSPESRGFVENSYLRGLTPQEFFFHAMAGREGLIDTAVKTAETGYIQRRLVKALEDVMVAYDGTVRNSLNHIVQFTYGEDGMDGGAFEEQRLDQHILSEADFVRTFYVDVTDPEHRFRDGVLQAGVDSTSRDLQRTLDAEYRQLEEDRQILRSFIYEANNPRVYLPVKIRRIVQNAQQIFHIDHRKPSDLAPADIVVAVQQLCSRLVIVRGEDEISRQAQENVTLLFRIHLRNNFASRRVLEEDHLNREAFEWVLGEVEHRFNQAIVNPGEMCGTLAAQSIGEPATQMTLNTFHYAGVASKNVTLGVPRLKEIINVARNLKTPITYVFLQGEAQRNKYAARPIQATLGHVTLRTVTASVEIFYDQDVRSTVIENDRELVDNYFAIPDPEVEKSLHRQSPWLLRFELDRAKMLDKQLQMAQVAQSIAEVFENDLFVIYSEDNAEELIIRCRALKPANQEDDEDEVEEDVFLKQLESSMLDTITLGGIQGIQRVFMVEKKQSVIRPGTGELDNQDEWMLETDGINLKKVLTVEGVDAVRTYSNNCVEIMEVLGIEAARASLLRELRAVIEFDGSYVNYRHLALLCDLMTNRGSLMAITRHGINRAETGALMRCTFEETVEILMEAAAVGEADECTGVAENVLLGQLAPMGTGAFDLALNVDMLKDVVVDHRLPVAGMDHIMAGGQTPGGGMTPYAEGGKTPANQYDLDGLTAAAFSPLGNAGGDEFGGGMTSYLGYGGAASPYGAGGMSPAHGYSPASPANFASSPAYSPCVGAPGTTSDAHRSSPRIALSSPAWSGSASPMYGGTSPAYSPSSPQIGATSPMGYSPASPAFSPSSPQFSPTSPRAGYSPASPAFTPASPAYSPASPRFSPASPAFSPASPRYSPASPRFSPTSPSFSPTSPRQQQSPASLKFSPTSPKYSPTSPQAGYSPVSPRFSPTSPNATGPSAGPSYSPASPAFSPASPQWSPTSPQQNGSGGSSSSSKYNAKPSWAR